MEIKLPDGKKISLPEDISLSEKISLVKEVVDIYDKEIKMNWDSKSIKFFLDSLSNYLVWHKDDSDNKEDKEVMSKNKTNRLYRGRRDILFSYLGKKDAELLIGETRGLAEHGE